MPYRFLSRLRPLLRRLPTMLPSSCALCGVDHHHALCHHCMHRFFNFSTTRCVQCGVAVDNSHTRCGHCLRTLPTFDATIVACDYAPPTDQLVLALKFGSRLALAPLLADLLCHALLQRTNTPLPDILTVVPLGPHRLAERGFNQSLEIARPLAAASGIPLHPHLITRIRETPAQTSLLPRQRHHNVRHAFALQPDMQHVIAGRHIAVLDDVMTTGHTLDELAILLKQHGASRVTNLAFARTPPS